MHPFALDRIRAFLRIDEQTVAELHESAELMPVLLAELGNRLAARPGRRFDLAHAVLIGWGDQRFTSAELLGWCRQSSTPQQRDVLQALRVECDCEEPTAQRIGIALAKLASTGPAGNLQIAVVGRAHNTRVFKVMSQLGLS